MKRRYFINPSPQLILKFFFLSSLLNLRNENNSPLEVFTRIRNYVQQVIPGRARRAVRCIKHDDRNSTEAPLPLFFSLFVNVYVPAIPTSSFIQSLSLFFPSPNLSPSLVLCCIVLSLSLPPLSFSVFLSFSIFIHDSHRCPFVSWRESNYLKLLLFPVLS